MDINKAILTGRIGSDLELRHTKSGTAVLEMNLAVKSGFGDKEKTNWIGCTLWGASAEAASKYLGKGRKIAVSGRLDQDEWEDRETGKKRSKTRVVVEEWTFADSDKGTSANQEPRREAPKQDPTPAEGEDDIPF
jgi:single-strand DNA-binding protein